MSFRPLVPVIALASSLALSACTDQTSARKASALETELEQQEQLLGKTRQDLHRLEARIDATERENSTLREQKTKVEAERDATLKDIEKLRKDFERYKVQYKLSMKTRAPGLHLEDFSADGVEYRHVTIKEFTDTQLTISHDFGVGKLKLAALPEPLRDFLGLNIVLPDAADVSATDPKLVKARLTEGNTKAVHAANEKRAAVAEELELTRRKLHDTQQQLDINTSTHQPLDKLKKSIADLEAKMAKLRGQLAQADMEQYEARENQRKGVSSLR